MLFGGGCLAVESVLGTFLATLFTMNDVIVSSVLATFIFLGAHVEKFQSCLVIDSIVLVTG